MSIIGTFGKQKPLSPSGKVIFTSEASKNRKGIKNYIESVPFSHLAVTALPIGGAFRLTNNCIFALRLNVSAAPYGSAQHDEKRRAIRESPLL